MKADSIFSILFPPPAGRRVELDEVRRGLFRMLLAIYLLLGLPAVVLGAMHAFGQGRWPFGIVYIVLYLLAVLVLVYSRRLPLGFATWVFLAANFALSVAVLLRLGFTGAGVPLLIAFCVLATVLRDLRWGIAAICLSIATFAAVGAATVLGILPVSARSYLDPASAFSWLDYGAIFLLLAIAMVSSPLVLRNRLELSLAAVEENARDLVESNRRLLEENRSRRDAEDALRLSEERYRLIVDHAAEAIFIAQDRFLKFPNPRLLEMSGYSREEILSTPFMEFIHAEDRATVAGNYAKRMRGEEAPGTYSFRFVRKDGEERWVDLIAVRIEWEGRPASLNFLRDITVEKRLEAQYRQAQKMEAIGTLAGGIAHDFNNLLQVIQGFAEILGGEAKPGDPGRLELEEIRKAAVRGSQLTRQLLTFSRKVESARRPVDLNREVQKVRGLLDRVLPKMIDIELRLSPDLKRVNADPDQLEQVLMNLAINARDAMPEGGRLSIESDNVRLGGGSNPPPQGLLPGDHVRLRISDSGHGMEAETMRHLFEPFFTTKEVGKGTGLGLAMVYGIVRNHEGSVSCDSGPGLGTRFTILLPVTREEPESVEQAPPAAADGGTGTILLVDDEEALRTLGERLLRKAGYRVLTACDGETALEVYRGNPGRIDLVILDLLMPGMGGMRCLQGLRAMDPRVRVLVASGYHPEGPVETLRIAGAAGVIRKPYEIGLMLARIREVLGSGGSPARGKGNATI